MWEYISASFAYALAKDIWARARGGRRRLSNAEIMRLRQNWKAEFEAKFLERRQKGLALAQDVIVRDMRRIDNYPDLKDEKRGISPWFKVGLMATYHRGIQVGLRWTRIIEDEQTKQWRYPDREAGDEGVKVLLMGFIPFENIEAVDWNGDEYYGEPHIYCYFDARRKEPYERVAFCDARELNGFPYYTEIAEHDAVVRLSKKRKIKDLY
jgi:hypothetical protein